MAKWNHISILGEMTRIMDLVLEACKKGNNRQLYHVVTFEILRDLPVVVGGLSGMLFEKTDKVLGIFKSEPAADLTDCQ